MYHVPNLKDSVAPMLTLFFSRTRENDRVLAYFRPRGEDLSTDMGNDEQFDEQAK